MTCPNCKTETWWVGSRISKKNITLHFCRECNQGTEGHLRTNKEHLVEGSDSIDISPAELDEIENTFIYPDGSVGRKGRVIISVK